MQRDLELAHKVLYFVEEHGKRIFKGSIIIEGYERDAVVDHLYLLTDGGYINMAQETLADKGTLVLTWKGCDYLDELRAKEAMEAKAAKPQRIGQRPAQRPTQRPTSQQPRKLQQLAPRPAEAPRPTVAPRPIEAAKAPATNTAPVVAPATNTPPVSTPQPSA